MSVLPGLTPGFFGQYAVADDGAMRLVYNTTLSAGTEIELPFFNTVNVTVDWGDESSPTTYSTPGVKVKAYAEEGVYIVKITGSLSGFGHATAAPNQDRADKLLSCLSFGNLGLTSLLGAFRGARNLNTALPANPATVINIGWLLHSCINYNKSIAALNTSNCTSFNLMFNGATAFNQPLTIDTSKGTSFESFLRSASNFNQPINHLDFSKGLNFGFFLLSASAFNQPLAGLDFSSATNLQYLLAGCPNFNQDLSGLNTGAANTVQYMFSGASGFNGHGVKNFNLASLNVASGLTGFANGCTFTSYNYTEILNAWNANKASYRTDLTPSFGASKYFTTAAAAREALVTHGWAITDGGAATETERWTTSSGDAWATANGDRWSK